MFWPRDLLGKDVKNIRIISWGYDSDVMKVFSSSSQDTIVGHAETLLTDIDSLRTDLEVKTLRPIIFIGHSLGGIVIKQALTRAHVYHATGGKDQGQIYKCTTGVIFLGTPHRGSEKASLAQIFTNMVKLTGKQPNNAILQALKRGSQILEEQRNNFASISANMRVVCAYEEYESGALGMIVPKDSAVVDGREVEQIGIPADHKNVCKFLDAQSVGYRRVLHQVRSCLPQSTMQVLQSSLSAESVSAVSQATEPNKSYQYRMRIEVKSIEGQLFQVVDRGLRKPTSDKWTNTSINTFVLYLEQSGTSGNLVFLNDKTRERFSVAVGIHNDKPWCDIIVDLPEDEDASSLIDSYYGARSGRLWDNFSNYKATNSRGLVISIAISTDRGGLYDANLGIGLEANLPNNNSVSTLVQNSPSAQSRPGSPLSTAKTESIVTYQYRMRFQFDAINGEAFRAIDKGLCLNSTYDKWEDLSDSSFLLYLHHSGTSGSLLLLNDKTGERFSVAAGMHNYRPWCDILTDLPEEANSDTITSSYYGSRSGRLWDNFDKFETTSNMGTKLSMAITMAWDGSYDVKVAIIQAGTQKLLADKAHNLDFQIPLTDSQLLPRQ
ncbi:hypothetical protein QCA50_008064 [Cerrena zonata]|uniref:DUF676 domain-containing protein n=1 Tax=Cerrena zonata TaxID=2478898 RepID=A0AAW0G708_9APHY